jgi:hypothetical protein
MVSYNPIRKNPAVLSESLTQVLPILFQDPNINKRTLIEELISGMGLPTKLLLPEMEVAMQMAAQMQMQQQMALGGAAAQQPGPTGPGGPPMGAEGGEAALMEALLGGGGGGEPTPEDALAAGGGAPIREGAPAEAK